MFERSIKGVKYQLWGLNLLVIAVLMISLSFSVGGGFLTFLAALLMVLLSGIGLIFFIVGHVFLIIGSREVRSTSSIVASLLMLVLAPFIFIFGIALTPPVNFIILHISLWLLLSSPIVSYMRLGGLIPGLLALVAETGLLIYTLMIIIVSETGIHIPLALSILITYFLFLEVAMLVSYLRLRSKKKGLQIAEGSGEGVGEIDFVIKTPPNDPIQRSPSLEPQGSRFRVTEFEFSTSTSEPNNPVEPASIEGDVSPPPRKKEPVVGKALDLDKLLFNMSRNEKKEEYQEKYTVEDEVEIDVTVEDLYLDGQDLYQILKVSSFATSNEIRKAYRKRALLFHPDRNRNTGPLYAETIGREMRKLNKAKEILLDPARRTIYDRLLRRMS